MIELVNEQAVCELDEVPAVTAMQSANMCSPQEGTPHGNYIVDVEKTYCTIYASTASRF